MRTVYSSKHALRDSHSELHEGRLVRAFERPERAEIVRARVVAQNLGAIIPPRAFDRDALLTVHAPDYVAFLKTAWDDWKAAGYEGEAIATCWPSRGMPGGPVPKEIDGRIGHYCLASETAIDSGTYEAARASADVALTAAELVLEGDRAAFGLCRPPGHHAAADQFGGYCFFNNAALAAERARAAGHERVAILDVDFHHGNGTQAIFDKRPDVLFVSLHGDPLEAFPYFLGHANETGKDAGEGATFNLPLPRGTDYVRWGDTLDQALARIAAFDAGMLIVSLGVDTFFRDPISFFTLQSDDFADYGARIATLGLPTVFLLEGGYAVDEIGINAVNVLEGFGRG